MYIHTLQFDNVGCKLSDMYLHVIYLSAEHIPTVMLIVITSTRMLVTSPLPPFQVCSYNGIRLDMIIL